MGEDATPDHVGKYTKAVIGLDDESFFRWFASSKSLEAEAISGFWDFNLHILTPTVCQWATQPHTKIALEIGYGGGRLLQAAQRFFGYAVGIDIHDRGATVSPRLDNAGLIRNNGETIPVKTSSIDFVYSFIVLMHLQSFEAFLSYLKETYRVLKPGGLAQLYFGLTTHGYLYNSVPANHLSLIIGMTTVHEEVKKLGFELLDSGKSYKRVPDGYPHIEGQQGYVTLKKPG